MPNEALKRMLLDIVEVLIPDSGTLYERESNKAKRKRITDIINDADLEEIVDDYMTKALKSNLKAAEREYDRAKEKGDRVGMQRAKRKIQDIKLSIKEWNG